MLETFLTLLKVKWNNKDLNFAAFYATRNKITKYCLFILKRIILKL